MEPRTDLLVGLPDGVTQEPALAAEAAGHHDVVEAPVKPLETFPDLVVERRRGHREGVVYDPFHPADDPRVGRRPRRSRNFPKNGFDHESHAGRREMVIRLKQRPGFLMRPERLQTVDDGDPEARSKL